MAVFALVYLYALYIWKWLAVQTFWQNYNSEYIGIAVQESKQMEIILFSSIVWSSVEVVANHLYQ